ncbi:hypothetical protein BaRGS_00039149 [Batillaria attramentaria]|uniref:CUB domain-containing protein n=1 Tax=Batillaria attramentaria TaxID=370345 RepID=A0ABD0J3W2_9CAEN
MHFFLPLGSGETCRWLLTSRVVGKVLQLLPLDMQVEPGSRQRGACTGDVVTVHDGRQLLVTFRSVAPQRYRGFAIKYSLVTLGLSPDSTCSEGEVQTIPLDNTPVMVDLSHVLPARQQSVCSWRVVADDVNRHVVIDLENYSELECQDGNFSVYDGADTSSPEIIARWCARSTQPFSSVYVSGSQAMVVIRTRPNVTSSARFRFRTRSAVFSGSGKDVNITRSEEMCWRDHHPVYWLYAESVVISPSASVRRGLIRVVPSGPDHCPGTVETVTAPTDQALVIREPPVDSRSLQYSNDLWCRHVINGQNEADHVLVRLSGELCEMQESCGDYVKVYDGDNYVNAYVTSKGRHVTFEISTDDRDNQGFVRAEFSSVPGKNYMCQYCITSDEDGDVIYLKVLDSDLTYSCSDSVEVYDGLENGRDADYLGQFCGQDTPTYISKQRGVCLLFRSDPTLHGKGWLLSYWSAPPPSCAAAVSSSVSDDKTVEMAVLGGLLAVVVIALIIVIVLFVINRRKRP